jgi:hypothetical protein
MSQQLQICGIIHKQQILLGNPPRISSRKVQFCTMTIQWPSQKTWLRLNLNMFKMLIIPIHCMLANIYHRMFECEKDKIDIRVRVELTQSSCLPLNMVNYTFNFIFGDTTRYHMEYTNATIRVNLSRILKIATF